VSGIGNDLIGDIERILVNDVLDSQRLFRFDGGANSYAARFEREISRMYDAHGALLLPSASLGLFSILHGLDLPAGCKIGISPFGWIANFSVPEMLGYRPHFLALDADLQLLPDSVSAAIDAGAQAILVVHVMGRAQRAIPEIGRICRERGVPLVEDIAQSFGVRTGGRLIGTFGCAAYCSLNHHKLLSAGDGGFVVVYDPALMARVYSLHDQGCSMRDGQRVPPARPLPGLSLRVNQLTAAVALAQLVRFKLIKTRILRIHAEVEALFAPSEHAEVVRPADGDIPFTLLFRSPAGRAIDYPSLHASGWHLADNVPYLQERLADQCAADPALAEVAGFAARIRSVGCGFIDKYYATPLGLRLEDGEAERRVFRTAVQRLL
jgi:dTDP-4-amino-4,6-dideoxygalactose transaminase